MNLQEKETIDEIFLNDGKPGVMQFLKNRYNLTDQSAIEALYAEKMGKKPVKKAGVLGRIFNKNKNKKMEEDENKKPDDIEEGVSEKGNDEDAAEEGDAKDDVEGEEETE